MIYKVEQMSNPREAFISLLLGDILLCSPPIQIPVESLTFNTTVFRYLEVTKDEINHNLGSQKSKFDSAIRKKLPSTYHYHFSPLTHVSKSEKATTCSSSWKENLHQNFIMLALRSWNSSLQN